MNWMTLYMDVQSVKYARAKMIILTQGSLYGWRTLQSNIKITKYRVTAHVHRICFKVTVELRENSGSRVIGYFLGICVTFDQLDLYAVP